MVFCIKLNIEVSHKLVVSFLMVIARHAQSTLNGKFVISLQYLKIEGRDEIDILHTNNHQTILQVDNTNLGRNDYPCPN